VQPAAGDYRRLIVHRHSGCACGRNEKRSFDACIVSDVEEWDDGEGRKVHVLGASRRRNNRAERCV
jgi:hypothetical protein